MGRGCHAAGAPKGMLTAQHNCSVLAAIQAGMHSWSAAAFAYNALLSSAGVCM